jgi:hypothetical protein
MAPVTASPQYHLQHSQLLYSPALPDRRIKVLPAPVRHSTAAAPVSKGKVLFKQKPAGSRWNRPCLLPSVYPLETPRLGVWYLRKSDDVHWSLKVLLRAAMLNARDTHADTVALPKVLAA